MSTSVASLTPADLRALSVLLADRARQLEQRDPELVVRRRLTDEGRERLVEILLAGGKPTIGFWRKYSVRQER